MNALILLSDQLSTWSVIYARYSIIHFAQTPRSIGAANAGAGYALARFAHRTLQALRQTGLQMCRWPGPWPQVLSLSELSRSPPANGLRATSRPGRRRLSLGKLPPGPREHRGDLRDQPRTAAPPRGALRGPGESIDAVALPPHRCAIGGRTHCQHARSMARRRFHTGTFRGERR